MTIYKRPNNTGHLKHDRLHLSRLALALRANQKSEALPKNGADEVEQLAVAHIFHSVLVDEDAGDFFDHLLEVFEGEAGSGGVCL